MLVIGFLEQHQVYVATAAMPENVAVLSKTHDAWQRAQEWLVEHPLRTLQLRLRAALKVVRESNPPHLQLLSDEQLKAECLTVLGQHKVAELRDDISVNANHNKLLRDRLASGSLLCCVELCCCYVRAALCSAVTCLTCCVVRCGAVLCYAVLCWLCGTVLCSDVLCAMMGCYGRAVPCRAVLWRTVLWRTVLQHCVVPGAVQ